MTSMRDILKEALPNLTPDEVKLLPTGYQLVGDIAVLNLHPSLRQHFPIIGEVAKKELKAASVCARTGPVLGELRQPQVELIAGKKTETTHTENGVFYHLDLSKVMFSKGNVSERGRLAAVVRKGETVVDMFAGIGYFSLPIAKTGNPRMVYAIELNPIAMDFLKQNIRLNNLVGKITPILGDSRKVPMGSVADRVIMGYLPETWRYLEAALSYLKPEGGTIHYHDVYPKESLWDEPTEMLEKHAFKYGLRLQRASNKKIVKQYSPGKCHIVIDAVFKAS